MVLLGEQIFPRYESKKRKELGVGVVSLIHVSLISFSSSFSFSSFSFSSSSLKNANGMRARCKFNRVANIPRILSISLAISIEQTGMEDNARVTTIHERNPFINHIHSQASLDRVDLGSPTVLALLQSYCNVE